MFKKYFHFIIFFFLCLLSFPAQAKEFRDIHRLNKPSSAAEAGYGEVIKPVEKSVIEDAVNQVFSKYNTSEFDSLLAKSFYNKDLLTDAIDSQVPRDAAIRVLGIRGMETLGQTVEVQPGSHVNKLVSTVSVTVQAQMEFNNASGFQRREGVNELILRITQDIPPQQ